MKRLQAILALTLLTPAFAQETKFFRLDFTVKELDENKLLSSKSYSTFVATEELPGGLAQDPGCSIRTGSKVPYQVGPGSSQYVDVGVNIDCQKPREVNGHLIVRIVAEVSSVPANPGGAASDAPPLLPVIRHSRWNSIVTVPFAKATTLFSSDDLSSKRKMQLELTVTPVK